MGTKNWGGFVRRVSSGTMFVAALTAPTAGQATNRVSVATGGGQADLGGGTPSISADGRLVTFDSAASNLVAGDTNGLTDVFVHDRQSGTTERVSVATGGAQGDSSSWVCSISADGAYVAFASDATNFMAGDTNSSRDIFVHDRQSDTTERVSVD